MATVSEDPGQLALQQMTGSARRRRKERVVGGIFGVAAAFGLVVSVAIVVALVGEAVLWL